MSALVPTTRGGLCAICLRRFLPGERQWTHVGGKGHDGFHELCLKDWLFWNAVCPYDRQKINPNPLLSRTDRIVVRLRPMLIDFLRTAGTAVAIGCIAVPIFTISIFMVIDGIRVERAAAATGAALAAITAMPEGMGRGAKILGSQLAAGAAAAGVAIVSGVPSSEKFVRDVSTVTVTGIVLGGPLDLILIRRGVGKIARENIGIGMCVGGLAPILFAGSELTPLAAIALAVLIEGVATGVLSLTRR